MKETQPDDRPKLDGEHSLTRIARDRDRLAQLLGQLLARHWLRTRKQPISQESAQPVLQLPAGACDPAQGPASPAPG
jgi:hypothetical protein